VVAATDALVLAGTELQVGKSLASLAEAGIADEDRIRTASPRGGRSAPTASTKIIGSG
jgi:hypothetical protein